MRLHPKRSVLVLLVLLLLRVAATAAATDRQSDALLERRASIMGTTFSLSLPHHGEDDDDASAMEAAFAEARRVNAMLSNYDPASELSQVNAQAAKRPVVVSPELFALLQQCLRYSRESEGTFDITVGALMRAWGFFRDSGHMADPTALRAALQHVGSQHLRLDPVRSSVFFDVPGLELDPGGVGKGYAVDRMVDVLRQRGISAAFISAGGSSIYGIGAPPGEPRGWRVPIRDPKEPNRQAAVVFLRDESLSTSGSYEKFFWKDGRVYSHIMDPRSGMPATGMAAVSVLAPRTLDSEVWAKPFFILGRTWTSEHKQPFFRIFVCPDSSDAVACEWLP